MKCKKCKERRDWLEVLVNYGFSALTAVVIGIWVMWLLQTVEEPIIHGFGIVVTFISFYFFVTEVFNDEA